VASATTINKVTITAPATGSTLTIADGTTLSNTYTMNAAKQAGVAGGIPWFDSTTSMSASALLTQYGVLYGGGASAAPAAVAACGAGIPIVGSATVPVCSKVTLTSPATGSTLTISDSQTLSDTYSMNVAKTAGVAGAIPWYDTTSSQSATALLTQYGVMVGGGASAAPNTISVPAADALLYGTTGANPAFKALPTTGTNGCSGSTDMLQWNNSTHVFACGTAGGGGGISGATLNGAMYALTATTGTSTAALTNGQLLIGSTSATPVAATITAGNDVTVTNGAGAITIAAGTLTGSGLSAGDAYYMAAGGLAVADSSVASSADMPAICVATSSTVCVYSGVVTTGSWTTGNIIYVGTSGALTATIPSTSGYSVQRIGVATSATQVLIMPSLDVGLIQ
jgi:hypothetical protein